MATFDRALQIALHAHSGTRDKGGNPYILHTLRVAFRLRTSDEELMSIAVMHDTIEDGDITFEQLALEGFSERVINALKLLTHQSGVSYDAYIDAMACNLDALKIKREDLRDNSDITRMKGLRDKDFVRLQKYCKAFSKVEKYIENLESLSIK